MDLSSRVIDAMPPITTVWDDGVRGLHARKNKDGTAGFYLHYRTHARQERRLRLGVYPTLTVTQARLLAREALFHVASGKDPFLERQRAAGAPTVEVLLDRYLKDYAPKKKSFKEDERQIAKILKPKLGRLRVVDVQFEDIERLHTSLKATPTQANRVHALLSRVFSLAEKWRMRPVGSNPARGVERFKERKRRRTMTDDEAPKVAAALAKFAASRPEAVAFVYVLMLSGARPAEIRTARWEWLDGQVLRLPDSKTGEKPLYLPKQVLALLEPFRQTKGPLFSIKSPKALWNEVRKEVGCPDLRLYDLRRTFASVALSQGLTLDQVGELYGHASTQTTTHYAWMLTSPAVAAVDQVATQMEARLRYSSTSQPQLAHVNDQVADTHQSPQ